MTPLEVMTEYLDAAKRADWDTAFGFFAEDMLIRVPGRSEFAGERRGRDEAISYIQTMRERHAHGSIELELIDMVAGEERVVIILRETFHGDGAPVVIRRANVYRVSGDEIVEIAIFEGDRYLVDEVLHVAG
jgi:ketosteroid isomerase-like protein